MQFSSVFAQGENATFENHNPEIVEETTTKYIHSIIKVVQLSDTKNCSF